MAEFGFQTPDVDPARLSREEVLTGQLQAERRRLMRQRAVLPEESARRASLTERIAQIDADLQTHRANAKT